MNLALSATGHSLRRENHEKIVSQIIEFTATVLSSKSDERSDDGRRFKRETLAEKNGGILFSIY